ncbi:hypothetical protein J3R82DRAFT_9387 [Butyriboletus roseoflavus]|nr:hypothetical protein J3R82DRAFT_9387 [Butyriboletus roseoflavus]
MHVQLPIPKHNRNVFNLHHLALPPFQFSIPAPSQARKTMEPTNKTTVNQPQAAIQMSATNPAPAHNHQEHHHAKRLRGGGAGKDCFLAALECFLCFECCKACCDCAADIICCPCEMCC